MTRAEAANILWWASKRHYPGDQMDITAEDIEAFDMAIPALRPPSLDENGLAQCGCGGKAHQIDVQCGDYHDDEFSVECERCGIGGEISFKTQTEAGDWWNAAMGGSHVKK